MDERRYEFLVVGPIPQPEVSDDDVLAGMTVKPVVDIDCTAEPPAGQFGAFRGHAGGGKPYKTEIVAAPFGKFQKTGDGNGDCLSYKVSITNPRRPHLLEVIYPDDRHRMHTFFYTEASPDYNAGYLPIGVNRCSASAISGWPRRTNKFRAARGIFWPVGRDGTVDVYTTRYSPKDPPAPAATARIGVYEIEG